MDDKIDEIIYLLHAKHQTGECLRIKSAKQSIKKLVTEARQEELLGLRYALAEKKDDYLDMLITARYNSLEELNKEVDNG